MIARITMPIILTREMSPNGRHAHWGSKSSVTKRLREDARRATVSHINGKTPGVAELMASRAPVVMDIEVIWPGNNRFWDEDNIIATAKPARDGIATALWGGEDGHVRVGEVKQSRGDGGLAFTFRAGEAAA